MQGQTLTSISLHEKQRFAFYSPATEILYGGAAGGGKSLLLRISAIRWAEQIPGVQIYLFRRTFPELSDNHLKGPTSFFALLSHFLQSGKVKYNKQDNEFIFHNGARIKLCHCQREGDVNKYQGAEIHVLMLDEATHFTDYQFRFLRSRVRCIGLKVPAQYANALPRIELGSNPGNIGHKWVKDAFITNAQPFQVWKTPKEEGGLYRQFVPAKLEDNPSATIDDPDYEQRLYGLGDPALVKAMRDGNWDIFAGQFFNEWNREKHILPSSFLDKIEPHWTRFGSYDHGYFHPYVFAEWAVDDDGNMYMIREYADRFRRVDEIAAQIQETTDVSKLDYIVAGLDCWSSQRDGSKTLAEQFMELDEFGFKPMPLVRAKTDRIQGASELRKMLAWKGLPNGRKGPRIFFLEHCIRAIECIPRMIHNPTRPMDVEKVDATETNPWAGDDAYDCVRYGVMSRYLVPDKILTPEQIAANFVEIPHEAHAAQRAKAYLDKKRKERAKAYRRGAF